MNKIKLIRNSALLWLLLILSANSSANPLLDRSPLPNFAKIQAIDFAPALESALKQHATVILNLPRTNQTWDNTIQPLTEATSEVTRIWNIISYLHSVKNNKNTESTYQTLLNKITGFYSSIMYNRNLYMAYKNIAASAAYKQLSSDQQTVISKMLIDFKISGADLAPEDLDHSKQIMLKLNKLSNQFIINLQKSTAAWQLNIPPKDEALLAGIPEQIKEQAAKFAQAQSTTGWTLTLQPDCLAAVSSYAQDRSLREKIYIAHATVASDQAVQDIEHKSDNTPVTLQILQSRQDLAKLHGYQDFAEYGLADKESPNSANIIKFLNDLAKQIKPAAQKELYALQKLAKSKDNIDQLRPWDIAYYSEMLKHNTTDLSQHKISEYFTAKHAIDGLCTLANLLFDISVTEINNFSSWDPLVKLYAVKNSKQTILGYFYIDLYSRANKRIGSWFAQYTNRLVLQDGTLQLPVAFITTNFPKNPDHTIYFTDVIDLFRQFGYALHFILTTSSAPSISGLNGAAYDAAEVVGQFMEQWAWQYRVIQDISHHVKSGTYLPQSIFDELVTLKNYNAGLALLHQVEAATFDLQINTNTDKNLLADPAVIYTKIQAKMSILPNYKFDRPANRFVAAFAGDNPAQYYSQLWTEMLACDVFSEFIEFGLFNPQIGKQFLHTFLENDRQAGSLELFEEFRGREPSNAAMLAQLGITVDGGANSTSVPKPQT